MPLPSPNLDDRTFEQLVLQAKADVTRSCPEWTDLSPHDPGVVLLELFAHMTETMLFRLNRLPEKVYVELLKLIGVQLQPPAAARTTLVFRLERPATTVVEVPRGTRVTTQRSDRGNAPVFSTIDVARIEPGKQEATVGALHIESVEAELIGKGSGLAGASFTLKRAPVVASTGDPLDLVIGVEVPAAELSARTDKRVFDGKHFRLWREVEGFTNVGDDQHVYVAERSAGRITFAPAAQRLTDEGLAAVPTALAEVPPLGREIRAWYRRGGGPDGNVAAGTLTVLKDPLAGVALKVSNPTPAVGGRAEETVANALVRGREEFHSLRRALTARDYEAIAMRSANGIARAQATSLAQLWAHAAPGTVEVTLVPALTDAQRGADDRNVTEALLVAQQTASARTHVQRLLDDRRPLGTTCRVTWARYKTVSVKAKVYANRAEDLGQLKERIKARLFRTISPLPPADVTSDGLQGWRFGQPLSVFSVYNAVLAEPGVKNVEGVELLVDQVPTTVRALATDGAAPRVVYAGSGPDVFRSLDEGEGWERIGAFPDEDVTVVEVHPDRPGLVAVASSIGADAARSRVRISFESGEVWDAMTQTLDAPIEDFAWVMREGEAVLLIATGVGLFELSMKPGSTPLPIVFDAANPKLGVYAVAASSDSRGNSVVALAAMSQRGVFVSSNGGRAGSFRAAGLANEDVRVVELQRDGVRTFVWAGLYASSGADVGKGAQCLELIDNAKWKPFDRNWDGGSCLSLAFVGSLVYAGTHRAGVLWCDSNKPDVQWRRPEVDSRLPLRTTERLFQPVHALASLAGGPVFAGGPAGVFRTRTGERYDECSRRSFEQKVTLAPTWLFTSGAHDIEVTYDETRGH